jgi:hypothetical protein
MDLVISSYWARFKPVISASQYSVSRLSDRIYPSTHSRGIDSLYACIKQISRSFSSNSRGLDISHFSRGPGASFSENLSLSFFGEVSVNGR